MWFAPLVAYNDPDRGSRGVDTLIFHMEITLGNRIFCCVKPYKYVSMAARTMFLKHEYLLYFESCSYKKACSRYHEIYYLNFPMYKLNIEANPYSEHCNIHVLINVSRFRPGFVFP